MTIEHCAVAILPVNDLDAAQAFFGRLGLELDGDYDDYRILDDGQGWQLHLNRAAEGSLKPGSNPFGLYLYTEEVDRLAAEFRNELAGKGPEHSEWGMYEFVLNGPDGIVVRVGWPSDTLEEPNPSAAPAPGR
jgi:catechol 2,3-dioxygenase-like lactoylglutathione lyase family enzyme